MTFEEVMESLGGELGLPLVPEDGAVAFEAERGGDAMSVTISDAGEFAELSADLGELPLDGREEILFRMLEANHLFEDTGGASLSAGDGRANLERRVPLFTLGRGDGVRIVAPFLETAWKWRGVIAGRGLRVPGEI